MHRLLEFIRSIYIFLLFFAVEGVAIYVYATSDSYTQAKLLGYSASVVGSVGGTIKSVTNYFGLKRDNEMLLDRIAELEGELASLRSIHSDSLLLANTYVDDMGVEYRAARVVSNTINRQHNHLMLNRGMMDGVRVGMAVVSPRREIVGIVMECADKYSVVMSVLNTKFRSSGMIEGDEHAGSIYWDGLDRYRLNMRELSKYAKVEVGAAVVSTGFSQIFPRGVKIGTVAGYELDEHTQSYVVDIDMETDITALDEVLVINYNVLGDSLDTLIELGDDGLIKNYHQESGELR